MPRLHFRSALEDIKKDYPDNEELQSLQVPAVLGGKVDIILGIGFNKIYPEVIQTLPSGLQILKSKFLPAVEGEVCCIGGPLGAVNSMVNSI